MCRTQVEIVPFWRDLVGLAIALTAVAAVAADGTVVLWESLSFLGLCPQPTRAYPSPFPACTFGLSPLGTTVMHKAHLSCTSGYVLSKV